MIPAVDLERWRVRGHDWPDRRMVERDLLVSRLAVEVARHRTLADELALRGGVALHELALPRPLRSCTALEYARTSATPIGPVLDALREVGAAVGLAVRTDVGSRPRVRFTTPGPPEERLRIRCDLETRETRPVRPRLRHRLVVLTDWFTGAAEVLTYDLEELLALVLRRLYTGARGRDLFDAWCALTTADPDLDAVVDALRESCRGRGIRLSRGRFVARLQRCGPRPTMQRDLDGLVRRPPPGYQPTAAAELVARQVVTRL